MFQTCVGRRKRVARYIYFRESTSDDAFCFKSMQSCFKLVLDASPYYLLADTLILLSPSHTLPKLNSLGKHRGDSNSSGLHTNGSQHTPMHTGLISYGSIKTTAMDLIRDLVEELRQCQFISYMVIACTVINSTIYNQKQSLLPGFFWLGCVNPVS